MQQRDIPVRAVLAAPVRVVYDWKVDVIRVPVAVSLLEHIQSVLGTHVVADRPSYNEPGIEVGHQEHIVTPAFHEQVGDICYPNLIGAAHHEFLDTVGIGSQSMPREGRAPVTDATALKQAVTFEHVEQLVTPDLDAVVPLEHYLEFAAADTGMPLAYIVHQADDHILRYTRLALTALGLVLCLPCVAKQLTQGIPCLLGMPLFQQARYLAPVFFLIGIL